jgi:hypothetical protein
MSGKKQFTVDEWFYHWLADESKYKLAAKFFIAMFEICDKIVLQKNTRLARKFYQLDEESGKWPPSQRDVVKLIKTLFLSNSEKIHWTESPNFFSEETANKLPRKDVYLVQICAETTDKILITTDQTLYQNVNDLTSTLGIRASMADEFINNYIQR